MTRINMVCFLLILLVIFSQSLFSAMIDHYAFEDPKQEKLFQKLTQEIRCLTCQAQSIAESNAEFAQDLRREVYQLIQQGASEQDVIDYLVQRYGDVIAYKPPVNAATLVLWLGPPLLLVLGLIAVFVLFRRQPKQ